jgi:hypothetical protein
MDGKREAFFRRTAGRFLPGSLDLFITLKYRTQDFTVSPKVPVVF